MNTPVTHPQLVAALAKPGAAILASLTPEKCHLMHMAYCIGPEVAELAEALTVAGTEEVVRPLIIEELGDIEFYFEGLRTGLGVERQDSVEPDVVGSAVLTLLVVKAGDLADALKKCIFYEREVDLTAVASHLTQVERCLRTIRNACGITREETLQANIKKLRVRYEKVNGTLSYSNVAAQRRLDKDAPATA
jgi:hypothetical protein